MGSNTGLCRLLGNEPGQLSARVTRIFQLDRSQCYLTLRTRSSTPPMARGANARVADPLFPETSGVLWANGRVVLSPQQPPSQKTHGNQRYRDQTEHDGKRDAISAGHARHVHRRIDRHKRPQQSCGSTSPSSSGEVFSHSRADEELGPRHRSGPGNHRAEPYDVAKDYHRYPIIYSRPSELGDKRSLGTGGPELHPK